MAVDTKKTRDIDMLTIGVGGMTCASCVARVERRDALINPPCAGCPARVERRTDKPPPLCAGYVARVDDHTIPGTTCKQPPLTAARCDNNSRNLGGHVSRHNVHTIPASSGTPLPRHTLWT